MMAPWLLLLLMLVCGTSAQPTTLTNALETAPPDWKMTAVNVYRLHTRPSIFSRSPPYMMTSTNLLTANCTVGEKLNSNAADVIHDINGDTASTPEGEIFISLKSIFPNYATRTVVAKTTGEVRLGPFYTGRKPRANVVVDAHHFAAESTAKVKLSLFIGESSGALCYQVSIYASPPTSSSEVSPSPLMMWTSSSFNYACGMVLNTRTEELMNRRVRTVQSRPMAVKIPTNEVPCQLPTVDHISFPFIPKDASERPSDPFCWVGAEQKGDYLYSTLHCRLYVSVSVFAPHQSKFSVAELDAAGLKLFTAVSVIPSSTQDVPTGSAATPVDFIDPSVRRCPAITISPQFREHVAGRGCPANISINPALGVDAPAISTTSSHVSSLIQWVYIVILAVASLIVMVGSAQVSRHIAALRTQRHGTL